jgi:hypothetical protein
MVPPFLVGIEYYCDRFLVGAFSRGFSPVAPCPARVI